MMKRQTLILCCIIAFLIGFFGPTLCKAQTPQDTNAYVVPDSLKAKTALFYGIWTYKYNDSTIFILKLNKQNEIFFAQTISKDSVQIINEGVWRVRPFVIAEIEITWLAKPGKGYLFYHDLGDHYLFVKQLKFRYDSTLSARLHLTK